MFKFLFKLKFLSFVDAPVGVIFYFLKFYRHFDFFPKTRDLTLFRLWSKI